MPSAASHAWLGRSDVLRRAIHRTAANDAEPETSIDHRSGRPQAPRNPEPSPKRVQGSRVVRSTTPKQRPTQSSTGRVLGGAVTTGGASGPRAPARHSPPRTRPRTGTAQSRQSGRPHPSHRATIGRPGWRSQRSAFLVARSSTGTAESLRFAWTGTGVDRLGRRCRGSRNGTARWPSEARLRVDTGGSRSLASAA